jgi:hypothetical protein
MKASTSPMLGIEFGINGFNFVSRLISFAVNLNN